MVERKYGTEGGYEEGIRRRLQVVYARQTREKQIFMEELKEYRRRRDKQMLQSIIVAVGPKWYQALSVPQRNALDTLEESIYQDLLEGRPQRTCGIIHVLGIYPRPSNADLMHCLYLGRHDPKEMLAQLYLSTYGYPIEGKKASYCLNARLMLSSILYLGLDHLIELLKKTFAPDKPPSEPEPKPKPKPPPRLPSPYLQKMVAALYVPRKIQRLPPPPMPDLTTLNEPYEEEPIIPKPPPPPPPPPPPKKRLPQSYCDSLAGILNIAPHASAVNVPLKKSIKPTGKSKSSDIPAEGEGIPKKVYGIGIHTRKKILRRRKPVPPTTGLLNAQYTINGVYQVHGKTLFVLGSICILPAQGELIHGGYKYMNGECITIHCGFRGWPPAPKPAPCDCIKKWNDTVFQYVKDHKCYCGHHYDFGNEEIFPSTELPYFTKPTRFSPLKFNYHTIFDLDPKRIHIKKEFRKIWETDSMLHIEGDDASKDKNDKKKKKKKPSKTLVAQSAQSPKPEELKKTKELSSHALEKKVSKRLVDSDKEMPVDESDTTKSKKERHKEQKGEQLRDKRELKREQFREKKRLSKSEHKKQIEKKQASSRSPQPSTTCLGQNPKPETYLRCALRLMRRANIAARLPDLHLVPELKEWMRRRLYGKISGEEKKEFLRKSTTYWTMFTSLYAKGFGHVAPPKDPLYAGHTTWTHKQSLNNTFRHYVHKYKLSVYRSQAYVTNLLWRTMYQAEFPDKKFREIYFSYLFGRVEDVQLMHPYTMKESVERKLIIAKKRYICLPAGYEPKNAS